MSKGICQVVECDATEVSKGLCNRHRQAYHQCKTHNKPWPRDGETLEPGAICGPINPDPKAEPKAEPKADPKAPAPGPAPAPANTGGLTITPEQRDVLGDIFGGKDERVDEILERLGRLETSIAASYTVRVEQGTQVKEVTGLNHRMFAWILWLIANDHHVYVAGPSGSGKTTLAKRVAEALDRPFYYTGAILQKYELLGYNDANGNYVSTSFYEAYKNGGLYLWDEIDASNPGALVAFNAALENGMLSAPNGEMVPMHEDFRCIAAANTIGKGATLRHAGRQPIDGAVTERYAFVQMDYDWSLTAAILGVEYEGDEKPLVIDAKRAASQADIDGYYRDVINYGKAADELGINHIISPRAALKGVTLLRQKIRRALVEDAFIWKGLDPATVNKIKAKAKELAGEDN